MAGILPMPERWDGGLREDLPASAIKPPFAEIAQDVHFNETTGPTSKPGFVRINTNLPSAPALRLNGRDTVLWVSHEQASLFTIYSNAEWTVAVEFTIRRFGQNDIYVFEWSENVDHTYGLRMIVEAATHQPKILISDTAGSTTINVTLSEVLVAGTKYRFSASKRRIGGDGKIYGRIDSGSWQGSSGTFAGESYQVPSPRGIILGGAMDSDTNLSTTNRLSPLYRISALDIHFLGYVADFQAELGTVYKMDFQDFPSRKVVLSEYPHTETFAFVRKMGYDEGEDIGLETKVPKESTADWSDPLYAGGPLGALVGDSDLVFDGISDFVAIPNAFRYLRPLRGQDKEFGLHRNFSMLCVVDPDNNGCTLMKFAPVDTNEAGFTTDTRYFLKLGINGSGKPYVSASYLDTPGGNEQYHTVTAASAYTDKVLIYGAYVRDENQAKPSLRLLISASDDVVTEDITTQFPGDWGSQIPVTDGDEFDDRASKYSFILGGEAILAQFDGTFNDPDDPGDFKVAFDYTKMFQGNMDQVVFIMNEDPSYGAGELEDEKIISFRYKEWTSREIVAESMDQRILSYWKFNEGQGEWSVDDGLLGNDIHLNKDAEHTYVEGDILTARDDSVPLYSPIDGIFEYFRALAAGIGQSRKLVALAGGAVYEVDEDNEQLVKIDEGYRNDSLEAVSAIEFQNDLLIASGDYPFRLRDDEMYRLGIESLPKHQVAWSIVNQLVSFAEITEGTYRYRVVYYSSVTKEESDWTNEITIRVKKGNFCSIAFGSVAEDDAVNFGTIFLNQRSALLETSPEPFDITSGSPASFTISKMNVRITAAGASQLYRVQVAREDVVNPEAVSADEMESILNSVMELAEIETKPNTGVSGFKICRIFSSPVGENGGGTQQASLVVNPSGEEPSYGTGETNLAAALGISDNTTVLGSDSGISKRPLPLPIDSPQATHIRFYRTVADGGTFFLAGETPIGYSVYGYAGGQYWIDNMSNDDLVFQSEMDDRKGRPPHAKDLAELGGHVFYVDQDYPYRLWWAEVGKPNQVQPYNFIDILDGRSLEITNIERYAGSLLITKANATLNLTLTTGALLPFRIDFRKPDVGCVGPHGVTNVRNMLFVASADHPMTYDSLTYRDIGYQVHESYRVATRDEQKLFVVTHRRQDREVLFADPTNGVVLVYNYAKNCWSKWVNQWIRTAKTVELGEQRNEVYFADDLGVVYKMDADVHNSGGNFITDAAKMNETLIGTGFTIGGAFSNQVTLTGFTVDRNDIPYIRGTALRLTTTGGTSETRRVLYVDASNNIIVESGYTISTQPLGSWAFACIEARLRSGQIRQGMRNFLITEFSIDLEDHSSRGWPDSHSVTIKANLIAGVAAAGELTRSHPVDQPDAIRSFPFRARAWQWEIVNLNPDEPFSLNGMLWHGTLVGKGVPLK